MHRSSKGFIIDASFIKLSTEKVGSFFIANHRQDGYKVKDKKFFKKYKK